MKIEDIVKLLQSNKCIENVKYDKLNDGRFNRDIYFTVRNVEYHIEWWINICYLYLGDFFMRFDKAEINGFWPNHFKNNLNFSMDDKTIAVIPVEEYEN